MNYSRQLLSCAFLFFLASCASNPPSPTQAPPPSAAAENAQLQIIRNLTDDILVALTTHDYQRLESLVEPADPKLSGLQVARLLLGPNADTAVFDRWDAQQIVVSLGPDPLGATSRVNVIYRRTPNRKPAQAVLTFQFHRSPQKLLWRLVPPQ